MNIVELVSGMNPSGSGDTKLKRFSRVCVRVKG